MSAAIASAAALALAGATPAEAPPPPDIDAPAAPAGEASAAFAPRDMAADPPEPPALEPGEAPSGLFADEDPFEPFNRAMYIITWPVDRLVLRPLALTYKVLIPRPVRDGARNMLANIYMPTTLVNDLAQGNPKGALHTLDRFVINTTLGLGGLIDVAKRKPFNLPAQGNGMANTLGYYGADAGPYLYLPILGPTTMRDMIGNVVDAFTEPLLLNRISRKQVVQAKKRQVTIFSSSVEISTPGAVVVVVGGLDHRAQADPQWEALRHQSVDAYAALRSSYLQDRAGEIAALRPAKPGAAPELDDPLADPAAPPAPSQPGK